MPDPKLVLNQLNLVARDFEKTLAFYRRLGVEIPERELPGGWRHAEVALPNGFKLDGTRLTYKLMVDSVRFGEGELADRFQVQEKDSTIVTLPLSFTYAGVGEAGRQLMNTGSVNYRVLGDVTVSTPLGNFTRPYDQTGRFSTLSGRGR